MVTLPSARFDGTTPVTFNTVGISINSTSLAKSTVTKGEVGYVKAANDALDKSRSYNVSSTAQPAQLTPGIFSESQVLIDYSLDDTSGLRSNATTFASFNVTFYHCDNGLVWSSATSDVDGSDGDTSDDCQLCSDVLKGAPEVGDVTAAL